MKYEVIGYQNFDTYSDGRFDYKTFETKEEAERYVKNNNHKTGNVKDRYKLFRGYLIQEKEEG